MNGNPQAAEWLAVLPQAPRWCLWRWTASLQGLLQSRTQSEQRRPRQWRHCRCEDNLILSSQLIVAAAAKLHWHAWQLLCQAVG